MYAGTKEMFMYAYADDCCYTPTPSHTSKTSDTYQ